MAVVLKIKRSSVTAAPTSLAIGELAYSELSNNLFFGAADDGTGQPGVIKIGGLSDVQKLAASTSDATPNTLVQRDGTGSAAFNNITVNGDTTFTGQQNTTGDATFEGNVTVQQDLAVNGGDLTSLSSTFNLLNTTVDILNVAGAASQINVGNSNTTTSFAGDVNIGGSLTVSESSTVNADFTANEATITGDFAVNGNTRLGDDASQDSLTINGATTIATGVALSGATGVDALKLVDSQGASLLAAKDNGDLALAGLLTVSGTGTSSVADSLSVGGTLSVTGDADAQNVVARGDVAVNGGDLTTTAATASVFNSNATTLNVGGDATAVNIGASTGDTTVNNNLIVAGNLTVQGSTTSVNSTTTTINDPIITLGDGTSAENDGKDRGIEFQYGDGTAVQTGFFGYDNSEGKFAFLTEATNESEIFSGTKATLIADLNGLADRADKLETARNFSITGPQISAQAVSFDGTGDVVLESVLAESSVTLGLHTTGKYAEEVKVSGLGLTINPANADDGTTYTVVSDAATEATGSTLVYRTADGSVNATGVNANVVTAAAGQAVSKFKSGLDGLDDSDPANPVKTNLDNFIIDGGEF